MEITPDEIQPTSVEIKMFDSIFVKSIAIKHKHILVPTHSHEYDHCSFLAVGSIRVWKDGTLLGDYHAPTGIIIDRHTKHEFLSLEDNTLVLCIHNIHSAENVEIHQENGITDQSMALARESL